MQIRDVFAVARKHRWIVLGVFVLTVGIAAGFAFTKPKKYEASATIAFVASDTPATKPTSRCSRVRH